MTIILIKIFDCNLVINFRVNALSLIFSYYFMMRAVFSHFISVLNLYYEWALWKTRNHVVFNSRQLQGIIFWAYLAVVRSVFPRLYTFVYDNNIILHYRLATAKKITESLCAMFCHVIFVFPNKWMQTLNSPKDISHFIALHHILIIAIAISQSNLS